MPTVAEEAMATMVAKAAREMGEAREMRAVDPQVDKSQRGDWSDGLRRGGLGRGRARRLQGRKKSE